VLLAAALVSADDERYPDDITPPPGTRYPCALTALPRALPGIPDADRAYVNRTYTRILRATQAVAEEQIARPILVGRPGVVEARLKRFGLSVRAGRDFDLINPEDDPRFYRPFVETYVRVAGRRGITLDAARTLARTDSTVIAALALRRGEADAMICGLEGRYMRHLDHSRDIVGVAPGVDHFAAISLLITARGNYFLADTQVQPEPTPEEIAKTAVLAAAHVRRFGLTPKIALLSHSDFGSHDGASARKMQQALARVRAAHPELEIDGEMHADTALNPAYRDRVFPHSRLRGEANVLIMPSLDAANIADQMIRAVADALPVGPILIGAARPAHILTPSATSRGVVNMTAVAVVEAQDVASDVP